MRVSLKQIMLAIAFCALVTSLCLWLSEQWRRKRFLTSRLLQHGASWVTSKNGENGFEIAAGFYSVPREALKPEDEIRSIEFKLFDVTPACFESLAKLESLDSLSIISCDLEDHELDALGTLPPVANLIIWNASSVTDAAAHKIALLKGLEKVAVIDTSMTEDGAEKLKTLLPHVQVHVTENINPWNKIKPSDGQ